MNGTESESEHDWRKDPDVAWMYNLEAEVGADDDEIEIEPWMIEKKERLAKKATTYEEQMEIFLDYYSPLLASAAWNVAYGDGKGDARLE
jgi:hypothetical protein